MLTPAEAEALIGQHLTSLPIESLPLAQCAGAVLRENVYAERDQPPFDRVTMDGFALHSSVLRKGVQELRRQDGMQAAGDRATQLASPQHCIEVMTGAVLPGGCDAVVPVELTEPRDAIVRITVEDRIAPFENVHRKASDSRQGDLLLQAGARLSAPEIAVAASAGMPRLRVSGQPRIVVISTGNELVEPGDAVQPHQIRRSNAYGVVAGLRQRGFERIADDHIVDNLEQLGSRLRLHLDTHDVLVLSGGVSMGKLDLVPQALQALGVRLVFHKVQQRPGKPLWFGIGPAGQAVFALPGNPVSTLVCLSRYVIPALFDAMGCEPSAVDRIALAERVDVKVNLTVFMPVVIAQDDWGRTWAAPRPTRNSGDFTSLIATHGFVELPPGPNTYAKGFVTRLYRW